jgi:hypothetical protein
MSQHDEHAASAAQDFGQRLDAFLADAMATGMADGNHLDDERIHIGPTDI